MAIQLPHRRFTVDEYHRMAEAGILTEDDRIELIEGEIVAMSPIGRKHAACVKRLNALFGGLLGQRAIVSVQDPIQLGIDTELQPDIALLKPRDDYYADGPPGPADTFLVIEVSDSTLVADRRVKVPRYAVAGVPEVWVVDLQKETIEVLASPSAGRYQRVRRAKRGQSLSVPGFPGLTLSVDDILG